MQFVDIENLWKLEEKRQISEALKWSQRISDIEFFKIIIENKISIIFYVGGIGEVERGGFLFPVYYRCLACYK